MACCVTRYGYFIQTITAIKCTGAYTCYTFRDGNISQIGTTFKCTDTNIKHTVGNDYTGQMGAAGKCTVTDTNHAVAGRRGGRNYNDRVNAAANTNYNTCVVAIRFKFQAI